MPPRPVQPVTTDPRPAGVDQGPVVRQQLVLVGSVAAPQPHQGVPRPAGAVPVAHQGWPQSMVGWGPVGVGPIRLNGAVTEGAERGVRWPPRAEPAERAGHQAVAVAAVAGPRPESKGARVDGEATGE